MIKFFIYLPLYRVYSKHVESIQYTVVDQLTFCTVAEVQNSVNLFLDQVVLLFVTSSVTFNEKHTGSRFSRPIRERWVIDESRKSLLIGLKIKPIINWQDSLLLLLYVVHTIYLACGVEIFLEYFDILRNIFHAFDDPMRTFKNMFCTLAAFATTSGFISYFRSF